MDPFAIALLLGSAAISFGIGRLISRWRAKRQQARTQQQLARAQAERDANPAAPSLNKSKRKREQSRQHKAPRQG